MEQNLLPMRLDQMWTGEPGIYDPDREYLPHGEGGNGLFVIGEIGGHPQHGFVL